jgi:hypothetical protein
MEILELFHSYNARWSYIRLIFLDDHILSHHSGWEMQKLILPQVQHKDGSIRCRSAYLVTPRVPANLKNTTSTFVAMNQLSRLQMNQIFSFKTWDTDTWK